MIRFLYSTVFGRLFLKGIMKSGVLSVAAVFLRSSTSKVLIKPYIWCNRIDMYDFRDEKFDSFANFFARKRNWIMCDGGEKALISPCDGMLSIYPLKNDSIFPVKGSVYRVRDLIPDEFVARRFLGGCCLIYRLQGSDYHHFCYVDDCYQRKSHYVEGMFHSVQPIACESKPVYRLNRRVWSLMETRNYGSVAQIEVGALLVGGIVHEKECCFVKRGEEMGHFELAGSTVIQFFTEESMNSLRFRSKFRNAFHGKKEIFVRQGEMIGGVHK